ncbi:hypothetical protein ACWPM1_08590 [Tsuneonella sp. HG249]
MRVALIALTEEGETPVRIGGRPVAWHQLQAVLALECEKVVCLARGPSPVLAALQREAEAREVKFHASAQSSALPGLVGAADTLFVLAPGTLADRGWLTQALGARAGVAVLDAEGAVQRGFERIDLEHAWAGVLAVRGDAVEALADLPPDADPISGLLRVALQRRGRRVEVPRGWLDEGRWAMLGDSAAAKRVEESWHERHVPAPAFDRPGEAIAHRLARWLLPRLADTSALVGVLAVGGSLLAVLGGAAGYAGYSVAGLLALTAGTLISSVGERLGLFARAGSGTKAPKRAIEVRDAMLDLSLIAIAASPFELAGWTGPFVAAVLILTLRLSREDEAPRAVRPFGDRFSVYGVLTSAAVAGLMVPFAAGLALIALSLRLFWPKPRS